MSLEEEIKLMNELRKKLEVHRPPPALLGSGRTRLPDKFVTTLHSLALETSSASALARFCNEIVTITTDMGVGYSLAKVRPAASDQVVPWLAHAPGYQGCEDEWDMACMDSPLLSFNSALQIAGLMHIISNICPDAGQL